MSFATTRNALALYGRMAAISIRGQMQYRMSFLLTSLGQFVTTGVEILGIWALFHRFGQLPHWSLAEVAFFYGMVNVAFSFTDALARGFDLFGTEFVKTGEFDRLLLRPRTTILQLAGSGLWQGDLDERRGDWTVAERKPRRRRRGSR